MSSNFAINKNLAFMETITLFVDNQTDKELFLNLAQRLGVHSEIDNQILTTAQEKELDKRLAETLNFSLG